MSYFSQKLRLVDEWSGKWTEYENFYYELTQHNRADLASIVSLICGEDVKVIDGYINEIARDHSLREHIRGAFSEDPQLRDLKVGFSRREGWYAFIRATKPRVVVESGVHHGVGACVIATALKRNTEDGYPGYYYGTDIHEGAGWLLRGEYLSYGTLLYGDSIDSLKSLDEDIDIFINDSDHSADYEGREY